MKKSTLLAVALQLFVWSGPKLTPEQAAQTLRGLPSDMTDRFVCVDCYGPSVVIAPSESSKTWPTPEPARRLDGSLLTDPPVIYGLPLYWPFRW
jgi:hypothetical protein